MRQQKQHQQQGVPQARQLHNVPRGNGMSDAEIDRVMLETSRPLAEPTRMTETAATRLLQHQPQERPSVQQQRQQQLRYAMQEPQLLLQQQESTIR